MFDQASHISSQENDKIWTSQGILFFNTFVCENVEYMILIKG